MGIDNGKWMILVVVAARLERHVIGHNASIHGESFEEICRVEIEIVELAVRKTYGFVELSASRREVCELAGNTVDLPSERIGVDYNTVVYVGITYRS